MRIAVFHELPVKSGSRKAVNAMTKLLKSHHAVDLYLVDSQKDISEKAFFSRIFFYEFHPVVWLGKNWKVRMQRDTFELFKLYRLHKKIANDIVAKNYDRIFVHGSRFTESPFILRFLPKNTIYYAHAPNYALNVAKRVQFANLDPVRTAYEKLIRTIREKIDIGNVQAASKILANSLYTKEQIKKIYKRESMVCYLGVDEKVYKPLHKRKSFDILFIGSKEPMDGYQLFEQTLVMIKPKPKIRLVLFEKEWISDDKKMAEIYNSAKITVCLAFDEPFGLVAIEAMACGAAVIAVDEAGYKETVVNRKTGYLVKRDPKKLSEKLSYLLKNESLQKAFGKNAREHVVRNFTWEKTAKELESLFFERSAGRR